ncbi:hypothetical protein DLM76_19675 [Leptospira yasudae]|uniref:Uncharacterized protein n=1 Tax=Leptospira yasudae TaxID=2202201 RepID=A0ABX9LZI8_9LEPT|nr:hypothetical protein DLM77_18575 [Leptospira yasudae]RHX91049.1 hypothetical protein DLM76_19675 [Leptospira yasudae]
MSQFRMKFVIGKNEMRIIKPFRERDRTEALSENCKLLCLTAYDRRTKKSNERVWKKIAKKGNAPR